ncbi:hypothetical protein B0H14DRAFT_3869376 [Mycena olivaceomarginata]|nr:hypothetical protein B0H14DRAFT_3869376 [Mycena olivaceomarginata]
MIFFLGFPLLTPLRWRLFQFFTLLRWRLLEFPPRELFSNATDIHNVANRSDVVQPLVGLNDPFDIAVTIWQRATDDEQLELLTSLQPDLGRSTTSEGTDGEARQYSSYVRRYRMGHMLEKTIFSDIVFRGVRLSDAEIYTNVTFQIPTEIFRRYPGSNYDLRASFMILPRSPSLLDHFTNYTSSFPLEFAGALSLFENLPFPLHAPKDYNGGPAARALDSFAINIPLLERHEVPSGCPSRKNDSIDTRESGKSNGRQKPRNDDMLKNHPHIITRTQLRVVRESRLFRRDVYLQRHEEFNHSACEIVREVPLHLNRCRRLYLHSGNWETMVQLLVPDPDVEGGFREESAYAPYMDVLPHAAFYKDVFPHTAGPKDIIPVPINRESCESLSGLPDVVNRTISDHMNITWQLSYSSVTPGMFLHGDFQHEMPLRRHLILNEYKRSTKHEHNAPKIPRPYSLQIYFRLLGSFFLIILKCRYWASRTTIAFISVPGTLCTVAATLSALIIFVQWNVSTVFLVPMELPATLLMLLAVLRVRVQIFQAPHLRFLNTTHQERMSARLDARTDWRWKCGGICTNVFLIASVMPPQNAEHPRTIPVDILALLTALHMTHNVFQLTLNYRAKVFAGEYKAAAVLSAVLRAVAYASSIPWIIGHVETIEPVSYPSTVPDDEDAEDLG